MIIIRDRNYIGYMWDTTLFFAVDDIIDLWTST